MMLALHTNIYHVTPITPNAALIDICARDAEGFECLRNLLVSFYRPDQLDVALTLAALFLADNGRFSEWMAALKAGKEWSEANLDNRPYYDWLAPFIDRPNVLAIMPDIPGAPSQLNDGQLLDWPFDPAKGLPVYHMDGPIARLGRLLDKCGQAAMGWIGDPKKEPVGCDAYMRRLDEIERELGSDIWPLIHMLRGIAVAGIRPFQGRRRQQPRAERASIRRPYQHRTRRSLARPTRICGHLGRKAA